MDGLDTSRGGKEIQFQENALKIAGLKDSTTKSRKASKETSKKQHRGGVAVVGHGRGLSDCGSNSWQERGRDEIHTAHGRSASICDWCDEICLGFSALHFNSASGGGGGTSCMVVPESRSFSCRVSSAGELDTYRESLFEISTF